MGQVNKPLPVKLIIGTIFKDDVVFAKTKDILSLHFGKIDLESATLPFTYTNYYEKEFGTNLKRKFLSFQKLIPPEKLAQIKIYTNSLEKKSSKGSLRSINIDPGYLDLAKLVLATTKDYKHRIYLAMGIYAEITLSYQGNSFTPGECTYPDYRTKEYIQIFNQARDVYAKQIR